jgi:hypothetical protein
MFGGAGLRAARAAGIGSLVAVAAPFGALPAHAAASSVYVFPTPGSRYNRPQTQIAFRGISRGRVGAVRVVGSLSGLHSGRIEADSDGDGASFLPAKPFAVGETVTVATRLNVAGATNGRFSFVIAHVAPLVPDGSLTGIPPVTRQDVSQFHSRPDLRPASVTVTQGAAPASEGDIFLAPQTGPVQDGPMIVDPHGGLVWFLPYPVSKNVYANDFGVQNLHGQRVLTWWQGFRNTEFGQSRGVGVIFNRHYQKIATVRAADGLDAGSHEFLVTPQGDAYITASSPVRLPHIAKPTIDSVLQEIDIKTGLVLFEWHALDHVPLNYSDSSPTSSQGAFDPYHMNSISIERDGNLLVSMRNTSAVYLIDHRTGRVLWTLGGGHSDFTMGPGTSTWLQHDAIAQPDGTITLFDNGGGPPFVHSQSRGVHERIDTRTMTATLITEYDHTPSLESIAEGGVQLLSDGNAFVGWGAVGVFSEYNASGRQIFDARFNAPIPTYRAYRFRWTGQPRTKPALAVSRTANGTTRLYASWNGATEVSSWRVLAGARRGALKPIARARRRGFETMIKVHGAGQYFAVQAVNVHGRVLARSKVIDTGRHAPRGVPATRART